MAGLIPFNLISIERASAADKPVVNSFKMYPDSIEASTGNGLVNFELKVSNLAGIANSIVNLTLTDGLSSTLVGTLSRTDNPINPSLSEVTFRGTIAIPSNLQAGTYTATAKPIFGLNSDGSIGISTDNLVATSNSSVIGAENKLLIRQNGYLNFNYATFTGPSFDKTSGISFKDIKFNLVSDPIWRVGESIDLSKYYELNVNSLNLKVTTSANTVCTSTGTKLNLISVGSCTFTLYTDQTNDYQKRLSNQAVTVLPSRTKPILSVGKLDKQDSNNLPKSIPGPFVYSPLGLVVPISASPEVCYPVGSYITLISGGNCTLNYSTAESADYLASDVYKLEFEITRTNQTINFTLPQIISIASKTYSLSATSSSGQPITYASTTPTTCSVNGSTLNLLMAGNCSVMAIQAGTTTIAPVSITQSVSLKGPVSVSKKLICVAGKKTKVVLRKTCPKGYKPSK